MLHRVNLQLLIIQSNVAPCRNAKSCTTLFREDLKKKKNNKNIRFCETLFTNSRETQTDTKITKAFPFENDANFCYMHKLYNCSAGSGYWIHTGYIP